ncbi:MAG: Mut7-C RNAse domain-containing protein [Bacteroidota bacterium]|nr:Mut7-C RNAse domain-containing protein [Bacteroidota bacterium]
MHKAYFRFYEELNDFLPPEKKKVRFIHEFIDRASVKDMIESLGVPHLEVDLILVNARSVDFSYLVSDNDEISIYPVFESFNIAEVSHLRPKPLREPKFIADIHLGRLARYLRMLGFDVLYKNDFTKDDLVNFSLAQRRAILTRDRSILKRNEVTHGYWLRSEEPKKQVKEVIERFQLEKDIKEFSRCMECNSLLNKVEKESVIDQIPPKVKEYQSDFYRCPLCGRIYWKGSHYEKMKELIKQWDSDFYG